MAKSLRFYDRDGATLITGKTLSDILTGGTDTAVKIGVQNSGDALGSTLKSTITQVVGSDGWTQLRFGRDIVTLSPPWGVSTEVSASGAGGVWGATGDVYLVVTSVNATGETVRSAEIKITISSLTQIVTITWVAVTGATKYRLYLTSTPGTYGATSRIAEVTGVTTYVYNGLAATTGTPASANTTGGVAPAYGSPPALSTTPITIGSMPAGKWIFLWVARVIPPSANDLLNPRFAGLLFAE